MVIQMNGFPNSHANCILDFGQKTNSQQPLTGCGRRLYGNIGTLIGRIKVATFVS
jgi:hypothetical protein